MGYTDSKYVVRLWSNINIKSKDECWDWQGCKTPLGYGRLNIGGKVFKAHRLALIYHTGVDHKKLLACHKCDRPQCCNPYHLFWGSMKDNMLDMVSKGRSNRGARNGQSKLLESQVAYIKSLTAHTELSDREIAECYLVTRGIINNIRLGKRWAHVSPAELIIVPGVKKQIVKKYRKRNDPFSVLR